MKVVFQRPRRLDFAPRLIRQQCSAVASAWSERATATALWGGRVRRSLRGIAAYRISARAALYMATLFLGLIGNSGAEAFWIRIPSISIPRVPIPHVAPPRIVVPHIAPHISVGRIAPHIRAPAMRAGVPSRLSGQGVSRAVRSAGRSGSAVRQAQQTPGLKRGISLADRGSNTTRHNSPTVDQLRQVVAPPKPAAQVASRSTSTGRSAAPGYGALCTSTAAGGWVGCGGNVWGHVGSCGHPATTTTCTPGTWLVLQLPPAPSPQGSDDDDWSDDVPPPAAGPGNWSDTQPLAAGPGSPGGGVQTPFDWKTTSTNSDCVGAPGGTAFFGIPGNPDQPPLDCGNADRRSTDISQFPLVAALPGAIDAYPASAARAKNELTRLGQGRDQNDIAELKEKCAELSNEEIGEDAICRCLVDPSDHGCQCRSNPKQPLCQVKNPCEVWKAMPPRDRGVWIENYLAETKYPKAKGWNHIGATQGGFFPHIDFEKGTDIWVQVKSVNTAGSYWLSRMQSVIRQLAEDKLSNEVKTVVLDMQVQEGGAAAANQLVQYGKNVGVTVIISEPQCN